MVKKKLGIFILVLIFVVSLVLVSQRAEAVATNCWTLNTSSTCESHFDCQWHIDPWGNWCEQKGCWNFWTQSECTQANNDSILNPSFINKSCSWSSTSSGWCGQISCWSFQGNEAGCTTANTTYGIECNWMDTYNAAEWDYPCSGPWEKNCWSYQNQSGCQNVIGCEWGMCDQVSCWDYSNTNLATCQSHKGYNGKNCKWRTYEWGTQCEEASCWNYANQTDCTAGNCSWGGSYCSERTCSIYGGNNSNHCINNTANLSCTWDSVGKWCSEGGCWSYNSENTCSGVGNCYWESYDMGWCQEQGCWNWDSNETGCLDADNWFHPGIDCVYSGTWCYENVSTKSCSDLTVQMDCMNSFYCWWNFSASTCNDPSGVVTEFTFVEWNPGCYIFDQEQAICQNTTPVCFWDASSTTCGTNLTWAPAGQLNCSALHNQTVCNGISNLGSCCKWQGGSCVADKFDSSCREQMEEPPEGASYCEDYNAYTNNNTCMQIAGYPWFMPCKWDNATDRCKFNGADVFSGGEQNIMILDNEQSCVAAGGKWILDTYPSTNDPATAVRLSLGRCDYKFDEERNCDKDCHACNYKKDGTNWTSLETAKLTCASSASKICGFKSNAEAPNGYGYCEAKEEFKKGMVGGDCDTDCSACTYAGDPTAACTQTSCPRPSNYCATSKAKCKWKADPSHPNDESYGLCVSMAEKTCEDKCDKCYDESTCKTTGGKKGNTSANLATVCKWETGICKYVSGADSMEVCWDGVDNNGDNKMDCADSMCYSDPFCGGAAMFTSFGKDCFLFTTNATCSEEGCAWVNENWGSWCDMPGAVCWKFDDNEAGCNANGNCSWHSGFGGMCEQDFTMGGGAVTCTIKSKADCQADEANITAQGKKNCTWIADDWCMNTGGYCDPDPAWTGAWFDCVQYDSAGSATCEAFIQCNWYVDSYCQTQEAGAGHCDHMSFSCPRWDDPASCTDINNASYNHGEWCTWVSDSYSSSGGYCQGKMMGGTGGTGGGGMAGSCWEKGNQELCDATSGCSWTSGLCDPKGFGGEMMAGMTAGGTGMAMGGSGMQCMKYDGNQTKCVNQTGCGWFSQPWPTCDINKDSNCPQYSFNQSNCTAYPGCVWVPTTNGGWCNEKGFECWSNMTLQNNQQACENYYGCYWTNNHCEPNSTAATTQVACLALNQTLFRWVDGWCNPSMGASYFTGMEMGAPPVPLGSDVNDTVGADGKAIADEVDITSFGMKDMDNAFGFGTTVESVVDSAACNNMKVGSVMGTGHNATKFYWYLDTDGNEANSNGCKLRHNATLGGYEFYIKDSWTYDNSSASVSESPSVYRCVDGSWQMAEVKVSSQNFVMCSVVNGAMVGIDKTELKKYPDLYTPGENIRVAVASADAVHNVTNPSDTAEPGYVTPGSQDFALLDLYGYETDVTQAAKKAASAAGFVQYGKDADCWTVGGCGNYSCKGHPFCVENGYGVESSTWTDKRIPMVTGVVKEVYPDSVVISYFTDKPANGTILFYNYDSTCLASSLNATIYIPGHRDPTDEDSYELNHLAEVYNDGGYVSLTKALLPDTTYYFKIKVCDDAGKCGESACSSFITESGANCPFCKFVSRIDVPTGWNVYYDLDQNGGYEHWQGHILGLEDGMFTNYTAGREANILLNTTDGEAQIEFINVTLTKSGMSPKIREVSSADAMENGTTTDAAGAVVGYVGMIDDTRDKIVNNLYPQKCKIKIPGTGTCTELWNCDNDNDNCVDRKSNATLVTTGADYCIWEIPCEFSNWAGGEPGTPPSAEAVAPSGGGAGGGGGGGNCQAGYALVGGKCVKQEEVAEVPAEEVKEEAAEAAEEAVPEEAAGEEAGEAELAGKSFGQQLLAMGWVWALVLAVIAVAVGISIYLRKRE